MIAELYCYLSQAAPFGTPLEVNHTRLKSISHSGKVQTDPNQKVKDWLLTFEILAFQVIKVLVPVH